MLKYLVVWWIIESFAVPCPQSRLIADEFGRTFQQDTLTLALCYESRRTAMQREFPTRAEAEAFVARGQREIKKMEQTILIYDGNSLRPDLRHCIGPQPCLEGFEIKEVR